jgi:hypothetical protein
MPRPHPITTGDRFGRLTALETVKSMRYPCGAVGTLRECKCDCGAIKFFATGSLRSGNAKSCGCLSSELKSARSLTHGYSRHSTNRTRVYRIWAGILKRCNNPRIPIYRYYGARGITVCERWLRFENFLVDMGEPPEGYSIDRSDNNRGYEPGNCAWASKKQQARNRRSNVHLTHNGETKTLAEWAELLGVTSGTLVDRLWRGWTTEQTVTTPKLRAASKGDRGFHLIGAI